MEVEGVCTPFGICSAASKPETNFPEIGPSTNHPYCPSLKERLGDESKVPEGVYYIPEIVINALTLENAEESLKKGIEALEDVDGVIKVSAGNYGGNLGKYKMYLKEILE
jgi:formylmethanofuran--tetrahydromethanopterin N-formyltransferase